MIDNPSHLVYTESHEWIFFDEKNDCLTVGITDYAQKHLGDIVYVDLPEKDSVCKVGEAIAVIESVKAASDINAPVNGTIIAVNERLNDEPSLVNESPYADGWLFKIKTTEKPQFLAADEYAKSIAE